MSDSNKNYESNANWFQISQGSYNYFITNCPDNQHFKKFREHTYTMTYDKLGRILTRSGNENTTWTYSDTPGHLGELEAVTTNNGTAQSYSYDALGCVTLQTETVSGQDFTKSYSYDSYGRVQTETWNTGFGIQNTYNQHGYLSSIKTSNNQLIWQPNAYNVRGQVTEYLRGTNLHTEKFYNTFGLPAGERTEAGTTYLYYTNYNFDSQKGNLTSRTDYLAGKTENFIYDNLNRLTNENVYNGVQLTTSFTNKGNITQKSDIGTYTYGDAGPHAVTGLTSTTGSLLPTNDQTIDYTAFNKASHISQGNLDYFITYGPDRLRRKTQLNSGIGDDVLLTKYYAFGDYEKEITPTGTRHLHYISGGDGLAAIYVKYSNAPDSLYFTLTDHLGSLGGAINSTTGTVFKQNFDAWGRKRNPVTWSYTNIPDFPFDRGYTGHEHLKWFGLINMNGRMYDAAICRFLSPDPFVQMPDYTQNFNRYSYALNNPLVYTDPSGEFIFTAACLLIPGAQFLLPIAIGADLGALTGGIRGANTDGVGFWGGAVRGAAVGAVAGGLSMIGGGTFVANLAWGAGEGALTGGLDAALWGNNIGEGMMWGAASGMAFASITSGIEAIQNAKDGYGFGTDIGRFNKMSNTIQETFLQEKFIDPSIMNSFNEFTNSRFGLTTNFEFSVIKSSSTLDGQAGAGFFDLYTNIDGSQELVKRSGAAIRRSMLHEDAHLRNIITTVDGKGPGSDVWRSFRKGGELNISGDNHGTVGYYDAIKNAGKLHIGFKIVESNRPGTSIAWQQFGWKKWIYSIPRRF